MLIYVIYAQHILTVVLFSKCICGWVHMYVECIPIVFTLNIDWILKYETTNADFSGICKQ